MKNQVLSIEQMRKLKELGVDINQASMCYISKYQSCDFDDGDSIVVVSKDFNKRLYNEFGPAFTLQDIIELLPNTLPHQCLSLTLRITKDSVDYVDYSFFEDVFTEYSEYDEKSDILNAAYNMLLSVIDQGYLKTK